MDIKTALKETLHDMGFGQQQNNQNGEAATVQIQTLTAQVAALTTERDGLTAQVGQLTTENDGFKAAQKAQSDSALTAARDRATKAAVAAHGQSSAELPALTAQIATMTDPATLATIAGALEMGAKGTANPNRQTAATDPATEPDDKLVAELTAAKTKGEAVNKTKVGA